MNKGLAITPRVLSLEQTVAQIEGVQQDLTLSILRAQQDILKNERTANELRNQRTNEVLVSLQETNAKMKKLSEQAKTAGKLTFESQVTAPELLDAQEQRRDSGARLRNRS